MWGSVFYVVWVFYLISCIAALILLIPTVFKDISRAPTRWKRKMATLWGIASLLLCLAWPIVLVLAWWTNRKAKAVPTYER